MAFLSHWMKRKGPVTSLKEYWATPLLSSLFWNNIHICHLTPCLRIGVAVFAARWRIFPLEYASKRMHGRTVCTNNQLLSIMLFSFKRILLKFPAVNLTVRLRNLWTNLPLPTPPPLSLHLVLNIRKSLLLICCPGRLTCHFIEEISSTTTLTNRPCRKLLPQPSPRLHRYCPISR